MPIQQLSPYLMFNGTAEQAIRHYERALGAKTQALMRFCEAPGGAGAGIAPELGQRVMHALLHLDELVLMVSDAHPERRVQIGSNVEILLRFDDQDEMERKFAALAQGGVIEMAVHDAFWGDRFGSLIDAYGVQWMFTCPLQKL